jgi:hypothetical protein
MQIRHLFLTSLLLSTPALAFPSLQDQEAPSQEIIELAERVRAQAELARVEVDLLLEQVETSREGVEANHLALATRALALEGQDPDRGYLGINMAIEGEAMVVRAVMPGSGADKAGLKAGDRILRVNKIMLDQEGAEEKLKGLKAGKKAKVTFERDGKEGKVTVSLSSLSAIEQTEGGEKRVEINRLRRVTGAEERGSKIADHDEDSESFEVHLRAAPDGRRMRLQGSQDVEIHFEGDHNEFDSTRPRGRAMVKMLSEDGQGHVMDLSLDGQDLEGLPENIREHIRELIREHGGEGEHQIRMRMERDHEEDGDEDDNHQDREHDDHDGRDGHDDHDGRDGRDDHDGRDGRDDRDGRDGHDGHDGDDGHNGHETRGKAIIKMLTSDGERTMEFDFDGEDLREMGGRVRQLMGGRSFDLGDVLARVRGNRNDRSGSDSRGLHREEDHDGGGDRDPRGQRQEQDRGMNRPQAFGRGRGMEMMRGRGRGGPEMFREEDHGEHHDDDDDGEFEELEERIDELEQRIEELEELLERVRGRRNR